MWDQQLTLPNLSSIPYRSLTVPCCEECNNVHLQRIESAIRDAIQSGIKAVRVLDNELLYLWLGKIFYGLLFKGLFLKLDLSRSDPETISNLDLMKDFETHRLFLQRIRDKISFHDFTPGSIFVFETQKPTIPLFQWDFCDVTDIMFVGVRMGEVGLIGLLGDGGAQQLVCDEMYRPLMDLPLHPIQFRELCAQFIYRGMIGTSTPTYVTFDSSPLTTIQLPLMGLSGKPLFDEWDLETYSKILAQYVREFGVAPSDVFHSPDQIISWLHDSNGNPRYMNLEEFPVH